MKYQASNLNPIFRLIYLIKVRKDDSNKIRTSKNISPYCVVAGSTEISNSLKMELLEIGALYDCIEDYKQYNVIGDCCDFNTINQRILSLFIIFVI